MSRRLPPIFALLALVLAALAVAGCGRSGGSGTTGTHPDYAQALKGAPAPLAALYKKGNEVLPGEDFESEIAALKGYPVVINVWASWCGPCQFEFPTLQKLSARYGKRVAFVGLNAEDEEASAKTFLREEPVPYPIYSDPHRQIARSLQAYEGLPDTIILNRKGEVIHVHLGAYANEADLEEDVRKYALNE
jgi:cytochrome c biogenesis protein CcmG/thiol:disulfide interchange protein DsbE